APAPTVLYTLSLHDALPISLCEVARARRQGVCRAGEKVRTAARAFRQLRRSRLCARFLLRCKEHDRAQPSRLRTAREGIFRLICVAARPPRSGEPRRSYAFMLPVHGLSARSGGLKPYLSSPVSRTARLVFALPCGVT